MDLETGHTTGNHHRRASSVARGFAREAAVQQQQYLMTRIQHMIMGLVVLFFVVCMLPPSYVLWLLIVLIFLMLFSRFTLIRTQLGRRQNSLDILRASVFNHPLYLLATGSSVNVLNLRLTLLDRDFDESDYDMLLALDRQLSGSVANPVSDEEIQRLPLHRFKIVDDNCDHSCMQKHSDNNDDNSDSDNQHKSNEDKKQYEVCSVCLDTFTDKEQVMSLPCRHYFHPHCITPWIKRQGKKATCPVCKQSIFEKQANVTFEPQV
eukprot:TRINITY_DN81490_c0_g1_i1.p1 TRINITY_DN81490_c0_g1~~TRINITY_DN81490_c0_g1_i1.p1  ORF type:complete len:264 (+),score=10.82 TRINITY_DN81490_c0_g1_i1:174-965(+)